jgi:hypothetical protein
MVTDTCVVVPVGALGTGVNEDHLRLGVAAGAHAIALDAGSTDSGPAYLATGRSKYGRDAIKRDLSILMRVQAEAGIPLLIGSCGTSGCDMAVDWTRDIAVEIARENGLKPKIALLYSEQKATALVDMAARGAISPLAPMGPVEPDVLRSCEHIVALMGPEPYISSLKAGADMILGGRTTDTAVIAAVPLMRGAGAGPAWHAAKIAECGGLCTVNPTDGGVMIRIGREAFEVEPLSPSNRCDPYSVSSHMLYENGDPFRLIEPGGILDVTAARYSAIDSRVVRVTGSTFEPRPYTMKLEGASSGPFQTLMLIGIQDPKVLASIDLFTERLHGALLDRVQRTLGAGAGDFDISLRVYGWNAVTGERVADTATAPREVGILFVATAETQEMATNIAKTCNPYFFHFPLERGTELPTYAFAFSPAEIERGQVHEFRLNHVVAVTHAMELVRTAWANLRHGEGAVSHG